MYTLIFTSIGLLLACGCKGCEDRGAPPTPAAQTITHPTQSDEAKRAARLNGRHLDPSKEYPKNADGSVACGEDVDCFVLQAQSCTQADLVSTMRGGAFGIEQAVAAQYRILGRSADRCQLTRHVTSATVQLDPKLQEALRKQGKSDDDLAAMKAASERALRKHNPEMLSCSFDMERTLSVALDVAESKPDPQPWRECTQIASPGAPAAAPAPAAAKAAPSEPAENKPAAKP